MAFRVIHKQPTPEQEGAVPSRPLRRRIRPGDDPAGEAAQISQAATEAASAPAQQSAPGKRGHAHKDERGKWQPTGDYEVGFGKPPVSTRFNGKPGPGRPKGSISYDKLLKKHIRGKRKVRVDGKETTMTTAELILMTTIKDAAEGKNRDARKYMLGEMARLFPDERATEALASPFGDAAFDEAVLRQLFSDLDFGEPTGATTDPLADLLREPLGPDPDNNDEWSEGDCSAPGGEVSDDE